MKAEVLSIGEIFRGDRPGFAAPFHQRPYRWSQDPNWRLFWAHWLDAVDADGSGVGGKANFLGALVCRESADVAEQDRPDDGDARLEVLDGQQRLLTTMMAAHALRLHAQAFGDAKTEARLTQTLLDAEGRPRFVAGRASYADQMAALRKTHIEGPLPERTEAQNTPGGDSAVADDGQEAFGGPDGLEEEDDEDLFAQFDQRVELGLPGAEELELDPAEEEGAAAHEAELSLEGADAEWAWDAQDGAGTQRLRAALTYFHVAIADRLARAEDDAAQVLGRLVDGLLISSQFVLITLDEGVSPFEVFERLNNLGEPLSALDLLKNQMFSDAAASGLRRPDLESLYRRDWRVFDDARHVEFWGRLERRGRDRRSAQDWFLRAYLSLREGRSVPIREAGARRFGAIAGGGGRDAVEEIRALCRGAHAFAEISGHLDAGAHCKRMEVLRRFASFAVEPMLIAMRMHLWEDASATSSILEMLESVTVRRFFAGVGGGKDYEIYARIAREIAPGTDAAGTDCVKRVANLLGAAQNGAFWPRDRDFKRDFASKKVANRNSNQQARNRKAVFRAVFEALDCAARDLDPSAPAPWSQQGRTVEHLYPLNGREHWPELRRNEAGLLETIGNLTLIEG